MTRERKGQSRKGVFSAWDGSVCDHSEHQSEVDAKCGLDVQATREYLMVPSECEYTCIGRGGALPVSFFLCLEHVETLGASRIPPETSLLKGGSLDEKTQ
jgi:hypothetical protein